jgi:hypothetical protein
MKEPIQNTSAQFVGKDLKDAPEPFKTALAIDNYLVNWMEQKKIHTFYCSDYGKVEGEWFFTDVVSDTSDTTKPYKRGQVILIREEYNPIVSLVGIPFMVQTLNITPVEEVPKIVSFPEGSIPDHLRSVIIPEVKKEVSTGE